MSEVFFQSYFLHVQQQYLWQMITAITHNITVSTTCIIFMVVEVLRGQRNDPVWPGVVLWKGGTNFYNSEGNNEHLLIACISEQSQEVCKSFFF